jgi:hypothetical protein
MSPYFHNEILKFPELQTEWRAVAPFYYEAKMRFEAQFQLTSPTYFAIYNHALFTSPANVASNTHAQSTSVAPPATSPAAFATSSKPAADLAKPTYAQKAVAMPEPAPQMKIAATNMRIALNAGDVKKYHAATRTQERPATLDPHLTHANRPGGLATTYNRQNPVTDADRRLSKEKAPPKGFHFSPSYLNLCEDEDPYLCRGIFESDTKCPFAHEPLRCQYRHYVHQETLDFVVTKRGVNIELIEWIFANYMKNTPASVRKVHEQEAGMTLHVPRGPSAFGLTPSGLETTKTSFQHEERSSPATSANASAASTTSHPATDTTQGSQMALHLSENKDLLRSSQAKSGSYKPDRDFSEN